jgi:20S proteasome subunit alpha 6
LVLHGLSALKKAIMEDDEYQCHMYYRLSNKNVEIGIVGVNQKFRNFTADELNTYIGKLANVLVGVLRGSSNRKIRWTCSNDL